MTGNQESKSYRERNILRGSSVLELVCHSISTVVNTVFYSIFLPFFKDSQGVILSANIGNELGKAETSYCMARRVNEITIMSGIKYVKTNNHN